MAEIDHDAAVQAVAQFGDGEKTYALSEGHSHTGGLLFAEQLLYVADLAERAKKLEEALRSVMIGGNHLGLILSDGVLMPYQASHDEALTHYGSCDKYEVWCCWKTIMLARDALAALEKKP